jgi:hypothetical protein
MTTIAPSLAPRTDRPTDLAAVAARYRAFNDAAAARYPELLAVHTERTIRRHLDEARPRLTRRDLPGAVTAILDALNESNPR